MAVNKVVYDGATLVDLTGDTVTADNLAAGVKATGANGKPIVGLLPKVTIDAELSDTSENPLQNKAVATALDNKHDKNADILVGTTDGRRLGFDNKNCLQCNLTEIGQSRVTMRLISNGQDRGILVGESAFTNGNYEFTGTDGQNNGTAGLVPAPTMADEGCFLKSDGTWTDLCEYGKLSQANTWSAQQVFDKATLKEAVLTKARIIKELYQTEYVSGTTITPTRSTMCTTATGATTLDMSTIVADCLSSNKSSTIFTAYIKSDADYTLTITNAGTIKYIGSASDFAITSAGLLLNILMLKDASGNVTSIVQASNLS